MLAHHLTSLCICVSFDMIYSVPTNSFIFAFILQVIIPMSFSKKKCKEEESHKIGMRYKVKNCDTDASSNSKRLICYFNLYVNFMQMNNNSFSIK